MASASVPLNFATLFWVPVGTRARIRLLRMVARMMPQVTLKMLLRMLRKELARAKLLEKARERATPNQPQHCRLLHHQHLQLLETQLSRLAKEKEKAKEP